MSRKKEEQEREEQLQEELRRVKMPKGNQVLGVVEQRLGGTRMQVRCLDNQKRVCRIPGRFKRKLWIREGDIVLVEPWELSGKDKGDIIFKYRKSQVQWLKSKGYLKEMGEFEEF